MKIKSSYSIISCALLLLLVSALVFIPKENWKKVFSGRFNMFASIFSSSPNSEAYSTNGAIRTIIPDGVGGVYIGGGFTKVNTIDRNRVAHILPDGTLDLNFDPNIGSGAYPSVYALALSTSTNTLYIGGQFGQVGTAPRYNIAAVNASSGIVSTIFNPIFSSAGILSLALSSNGSILYMGGYINEYIAGAQRQRILALNTLDGSVITAFDSNTDNGVRILVLSPDGNTLYMGGDFTTINSTTPRNHIAAVNTFDGSVVSDFNPNANDSVNAIALSPDGNILYLGGSFTDIGGITRNRVAAVYTSDGSVISTFDPNVNWTVSALALSGSSLYIGGFFTQVGTTTRNNIAAVNTLDGSVVTDYNPNANRGVLAIASSPDGSTLYLGGWFTQVGGETSPYSASFPATYNSVSANPNASCINPIATNIGPITKNVGDSQFTMTVSGADFISSSIVQFNGTDRATTFVSSTTLTAQIPATDLIIVGSYPITVVNPAPLGCGSNPSTTTPTTASSTASTTPPISTAVSCFTKPYPSSLADVKNLQTFLNNQGYTITINGSYDIETTNAVISFQEFNAISGTGNFGNITMNAANAILGCPIIPVPVIVPVVATPTPPLPVPEPTPVTPTEPTNTNNPTPVTPTGTTNTNNSTLNIVDSARYSYDQTLALLSNSMRTIGEIANSSSTPIITKITSIVGIILSALISFLVILFTNKIVLIILLLAVIILLIYLFDRKNR